MPAKANDKSADKSKETVPKEKPKESASKTVSQQEQTPSTEKGVVVMSTAASVKE